MNKFLSGTKNTAKSRSTLQARRHANNSLGSLPEAFLRFVLLLVGICISAVTFPSLAQTNPPELFTVLAADKALDINSVQAKQLEQIGKRVTTSKVSLISINLDAFKSDGMQITLPGAKSLRHNKSKSLSPPGASMTWSGDVKESLGSSTFVVIGGRVTGTIRDGNALYRIEPINDDGHVLIKVDESRFPPDHPPSFGQKEKADKSGVIPKGQLDVNLPTAPVNIDVLVAYTPSAKSAVADIQGTIQLAVEEANKTYQNSGVMIHLTLVNTFEFAYSEGGNSFDKILDDFVAAKDVNSKRDSSKADLAALIINKSDYCGLAKTILADASSAFAVVYFECATGYYSFAHELGHLQGARHDPANDPTLTPFPFGHGFQQTTVAPFWRTVMAYNCANDCKRLPYWSNPNVMFNGISTGTVAQNDNARVLNTTARSVAAFR